MRLLEAQARGVIFADIASDGARGIRAGVEQAELGIPLRADLFHLLRDAHGVLRHLEARGYRCLEQADKVRRALHESDLGHRRRGRPLKVTLSLEEAERNEWQAMEQYDSFAWLYGQVRQALEPWQRGSDLEWYFGCVKTSRQTIEAALALMEAMSPPRIQAYAKKLRDHLEELLAPLEWLEEQLLPMRRLMDLPTESMLLWAFLHRDVLELDIGSAEGFTEEIRPLARAFWERLAMFHRSSSLAECLHSWLRPHLVSHRGMPEWLMPLPQLYWNHHTFQRGKRQGATPLELAGTQDPLTWEQILKRLVKQERQEDGNTQEAA